MTDIRLILQLSLLLVKISLSILMFIATVTYVSPFWLVCLHFWFAALCLQKYKNHFYFRGLESSFICRICMFVNNVYACFSQRKGLFCYFSCSCLFTISHEVCLLFQKRPQGDKSYVRFCHKNPKKTRWWYDDDNV